MIPRREANQDKTVVRVLLVLVHPWMAGKRQSSQDWDIGFVVGQYALACLFSATRTQDRRVVGPPIVRRLPGGFTRAIWVVVSLLDAATLDRSVDTLLCDDPPLHNM